MVVVLLETGAQQITRPPGGVYEHAVTIAPMTINKKTTKPMNSTTPSAGELFFAALICTSLLSFSTQNLGHDQRRCDS